MGNSQLPQHPVEATLAPFDGAVMLSLERSLPAAPAELWSALTDRWRVVGWAPYRPSRDLTATGTVHLPEATSVPDDGDDDDPDTRGEVVTVVPGRMLSLTWGDDTLDFEVVPTDTATVLRLNHTFDDPANASSYAAGWHLCLTALDGITQGADVPTVIGEAAKLHGWDSLNERYEKLFSTKNG